jgi:hypothetical protein
MSSDAGFQSGFDPETLRLQCTYTFVSPWYCGYIPLCVYAEGCFSLSLSLSQRLPKRLIGRPVASGRAKRKHLVLIKEKSWS